MGKLTATAVKAVKTPGRHADGENLYLVVKPSGTKSWLLRAQANGRRRDIGLGSYPTISLAEAREAAMRTRKLVRAGEDPVAVKKEAKRAAAAIPTFHDAAEKVHAERMGDWENVKHRSQWINTLRTYAFPAIGSKPIDKVTSGDVRAVILPLWQTKPETARRLLQRIGKVLDWGHSEGHCPAEAPMRSIRLGLNTQTKQVRHFASLPHAEVSSLMAKLAERDTAGRLALRFTILTAARSGEVRGATWEEIDLSRGQWTVPAARMKARKEHVVPLSRAALAVLEAAAQLRRGVEGEPIFPGSRDKRVGGTDRDKQLSEMTLTKVLRTAINGGWTVHGFRSSFRVWAAENGYQHEPAEAALAHTIQNKVVKSYLRTDFLEQRRPMMAAWADHVVRAAVPRLQSEASIKGEP